MDVNGGKVEDDEGTNVAPSSSSSSAKENSVRSYSTASLQKCFSDSVAGAILRKFRQLLKVNKFGSPSGNESENDNHSYVCHSKNRVIDSEKCASLDYKAYYVSLNLRQLKILLLSHLVPHGNISEFVRIAHITLDEPSIPLKVGSEHRENIDLYEIKVSGFLLVRQWRR